MCKLIGPIQCLSIEEKEQRGKGQQEACVSVRVSERDSVQVCVCARTLVRGVQRPYTYMYA